MMIIYLLTCFLNPVHTQDDFEIGFVIPSTITSMPIKVNSTLVQIKLPNITRYLMNCNEGQNKITSLISTMEPYDKDKALLNYPLPAIADDIVHQIKKIQNLILRYQNLMKREFKSPAYLPSDEKLISKIIAPNPQEYLSKIDAIDGNVYISLIRTLEKTKVTNDSGPSFRSGPQFQKLLEYSEMYYYFIKELYLELRIYIELLEAVMRSDVELLDTYPYRNYFYSHFGNYKITSVHSFKNLDIHCQIGTYDENQHLIIYQNIQYFGFTIKNQFYSELEDPTLFELRCFEKFCSPYTTPCSLALTNNTLSQILLFCTFERDDSPYSIPLDSGILIQNKLEERIELYLEHKGIKIESVPAFVALEDCIEEGLGNFAKYCLNSPFSNVRIHYSMFDKTSLYKFFNPKWFSKILLNFSDVALIISTFIVIMVTYVSLNTIICVIKIGYKKAYKHKTLKRKQLEDEMIPLQNKKFKSKILKEGHHDPNV